MIRDAIIDWNVDINDNDSESATHCVRRFGVPKPNGESGYTSKFVVSSKLSQTNSTELIVSYSDGDVYLFDINADSRPTPIIPPTGPSPHRNRERTDEYSNHAPVVSPIRSYTGHRNKDTVKDVNYLFGESCVASGSDDGNLFIWDKQTAALQGIFHADSSVVNVMQNHPTLPIVAVSGIENTIKILSPSITISTSSLDQQEVSQNLVGNGDAIAQRNREHRDDSADAFDGADTQALFAMIAAQLGRGQRVPDSLEIVEGEGGVRTILVDGEELENCSVM